MYKITIEKITREEQNRVSYEKVADTGNPRDNGAVYEYVPLKDIVSVRREVLVQEVDDIDLKVVIKALNGIE